MVVLLYYVLKKSEINFNPFSLCCSDLSYENLKFLSSKQALADVAHFIRSMNQKYSFSSKQKWIVFGGSYPGALAAWSRQKYPHLIYGAISSSAPLLAKVDFVGTNKNKYFLNLSKTCLRVPSGRQSLFGNSFRRLLEGFR